MINRYEPVKLGNGEVVGVSELLRVWWNDLPGNGGDVEILGPCPGGLGHVLRGARGLWRIVHDFIRYQEWNPIVGHVCDGRIYTPNMSCDIAEIEKVVIAKGGVVDWAYKTIPIDSSIVVTLDRYICEGLLSQDEEFLRLFPWGKRDKKGVAKEEFYTIIPDISLVQFVNGVYRARIHADEVRDFLEGIIGKVEWQDNLCCFADSEERAKEMLAEQLYEVYYTLAQE